MIEEDSATDRGGRVDIALKHRGRAALQIEREILAAPAIEPVSQTMRLDRVEAFIVKHRLNEPAGRRIAVDGRDDIGAKSFTKRRLIFERVIIGLADQISRNVGMGEPLADAVSDRRFERVMMKNVLVDKGCELRLAA